jgi:hypothetical protein
MCEARLALKRRAPADEPAKSYRSTQDRPGDREGGPEALIAVVLLELADAYVLHRDGVRYAYMRDPVVELDVERFMRRTDSHDAFVQTNVAKFRDRYGYR